MIPPVLAPAVPAPPSAVPEPAADPDGGFARVLESLRGPGRDDLRDDHPDPAEETPEAPDPGAEDRGAPPAVAAAMDAAAPRPDRGPAPEPATVPVDPAVRAAPDAVAEATDTWPPSRPDRAAPAPAVAALPAAEPSAGLVAAAEGPAPAPGDARAAPPPEVGSAPTPPPRTDGALLAAGMRIAFPGLQGGPLLVALDGGELGRLRLECRVEDGVLHLRPESDLPAARDLLLRAGDLLDREARAAGLSGAILDDGSGRGGSRRPAPGRAPPAGDGGLATPGLPALPAVVVVHRAAAAAAGLDLRL